MHSLLFLTLLLLCPPHSPAAADGAARCTTTTPLKTYRNCITLPTQTASLAWTYHSGNATLDVAFTGAFISPSGWVAWGINPDAPEMTGTRALIAFSDPSSGALLLLPYVLDPSVKLQRSPLTSRPLDLHLLSSSASLVTGAAVREGAAVRIDATFHLPTNRTHIHHVWNRGLYVQGNSPTIHPTTADDLASRMTIDVSNAAASTGGGRVTPPPDWLRPLHGLLNAVSWGFMIPAGAAAARYLRQSASPAWFYAHAAVQVTGFLIGAVGFATGLVLGAASPGVVYGLHRALGVTAFCAGGLQAAALMFRPGTTHRCRRYWKSYHHLVGYGCVVVGVVNVFQGLEVMGLARSYAKLAYCLVLATLMGVCVALEVNGWVVFCRKAEEEKMRREGREGEGEGHYVLKGRVSF